MVPFMAGYFESPPIPSLIIIGGAARGLIRSHWKTLWKWQMATTLIFIAKWIRPT